MPIQKFDEVVLEIKSISPVEATLALAERTVTKCEPKGHEVDASIQVV